MIFNLSTVSTSGVTEYSFTEESNNVAENVTNQSTPAVEPVINTEKPVRPLADCEIKSDKPVTVTGEVRLREKKPDAVATENRSKHSFDIVKMFDKLLLPNNKQEEKQPVNKPVSRIPVARNRWSWNFGLATKSPTATDNQNQSKLPKASTDTDIKTQDKGSSDNQSGKNKQKVIDASRKYEHFPKHSVKNERLSKGGKSTSKAVSSRVTVPAPPKPPRLVQSENEPRRNPTSLGSRGKATATL